MLNKKAIIFDLDNTLYEYEKVHNKALKSVYLILKEEKDISYKEFESLYEISKKEIKDKLYGTASSHNRILYFQRLIEKLYINLESDIILKLYNTYWDNFLDNMELKKGVIDTFKNIKDKGIKIAIISDLTAYIQLRKISKLGISSFIDVLVTSEEAGIEKPNLSIFLFTLDKLKVSPSDVIMIGDNIINDIYGGNLVGIYTILITNDNIINYNLDFQKPNNIIRNISEVLKILDI